MARILTMGEIMMRLTPPSHQRLVQTNDFHAYFGGAEANVAMNMSQFGHDASFLTALPANAMGEAAKRRLRAAGVETNAIMNQGRRLGLYYFEEGYSVKPAEVIYDRADSSVWELMDAVLDWDQLLAGVEVFHVSGITPALGPEMHSLTMTALKEAASRGVHVSFDCNYRAKLWSPVEAKASFEEILPYVDVCFIGHKDFVYLLGVDGDEAFSPEQLERFYEQAARVYQISAMASTHRTAASASSNTLTGYYYDGSRLHASSTVSFDLLERVGGGDSFASGILHGMQQDWDPQAIVDFATGSSVLKQMVYGDSNQFDEAYVLQFVENQGNDVKR
ncbi:2-dehydro-3-deoxygluconokinase [Marinococcus luteus]|uniref:2-dehydro-3-deoxygluconokinase n=1 Tax=Marinococcus luteus TaxID=1122204 RepID=A0A1H2QQF1_9BACI|nr:sugar kinase [Marinococcus luteus]SDW09423.1 2-dehydro-3-deoxygluconokinase [Marinococcus luteus]